VAAHSARNWKAIAQYLPHRSDVQCLHRWQKVLRPGLVKGPWTPHEDDALVVLVQRIGTKRWSRVAQELHTGRLGKQCRERWTNHLDPSINKGPWTAEEDDAIMGTHAMVGSKWAQIARAVGNGRTDNAIKNRWNSTLKRVVRGEMERPRYAADGGGSSKEKAATETVGSSRKRSLEPPSSSSSSKTGIDDVDNKLHAKDRSMCSPAELDQIRRERNRLHARRSRERKRARRAETEAAASAAASTATAANPNAAEDQQVVRHPCARKVSTATPPPITPNGTTGSEPSTPSTLASAIKSIRSYVSDDDAIAAEALSALNTSSPLDRPRPVIEDTTVTSSERRAEGAVSPESVPELSMPSLPSKVEDHPQFTRKASTDEFCGAITCTATTKNQENEGEEDAVGLLLHFNSKTKSLQYYVPANN